MDLVERVTLTFMAKRGYVALKKIDDFFDYPSLGIKWTPFLLKSIIKEYGIKLTVVDHDYRDYRYITGIIVERRLGINTYDEVISHALRLESQYMPSRKIEEIEDWLRKEELISRGIPETFFEKGIISYTEQGAVRIN